MNTGDDARLRSDGLRKTFEDLLTQARTNRAKRESDSAQNVKITPSFIKGVTDVCKNGGLCGGRGWYTEDLPAGRTAVDA